MGRRGEEGARGCGVGVVGVAVVLGWASRVVWQRKVDDIIDSELEDLAFNFTQLHLCFRMRL